jgi:hypothetical protein
MIDRQFADLALPILNRLYARELTDLIARFEEQKPGPLVNRTKDLL